MCPLVFSFFIIAILLLLLLIILLFHLLHLLIITIKIRRTCVCQLLVGRGQSWCWGVPNVYSLTLSWSSWSSSPASASTSSLSPLLSSSPSASSQSASKLSGSSQWMWSLMWFRSSTTSSSLKRPASLWWVDFKLPRAAKEEVELEVGPRWIIKQKFALLRLNRCDSGWWRYQLNTYWWSE